MPSDLSEDQPGAVAPIVWYRSPPVQIRVRLLARLAGMSPAEVGHRLRRAMRKRLGRTRSQNPSALTPASARELVPSSVHGGALERLVATEGGRGFVTPEERRVLCDLLHRQVPEVTSRLVERARHLRDGGIVLLGRRFCVADPEFDWHADPELGRLWPARVLDDADAVRGVAADVKLVWEVNRLQFLTIPARAAALTGDDAHGRLCASLLRGWIESNPRPIGVNWASNLEVAVRAISMVWTLDLLAGSEALDDDTAVMCLASLRQHRDHLLGHLSVYTDPTNHLIGEAAALAILSIRFREWPDSAPMQSTALSVLARELGRQTHRDGVSREQSTGYHRFVLDLALQVLRIAELNGIEPPRPIEERCRAMLEAIGELIGADGRAPHIGDSDGGRGLPFFGDDYWDFRGLLDLGAAVLGTGGAGSPEREAALWLGGQAAWVRTEPPQRAPVRSRVLEESGYAILRDPSDAGASRLLFDCGPLGMAPHASHGHADLLSVTVDVAGRAVLVDSGTRAYWDPDDTRSYFRSTRAHNTVEVGGRDQADSFDPFKWLNLTDAGLLDQRIDEKSCYVEAHHGGYLRLRPAVRHRRAVLGLPGGWLVIDWLDAMGRVAFTRWLHGCPDAEATKEADGSLLVRLRGGPPSLSVRALEGSDTDAAGRFVVESAPISNAYGETTSAPALAFRERTTLPAMRAMLLARCDESDRPQLRLRRPLSCEPSGAIVLELRDAFGADRLVRIRPAANNPTGRLEGPSVELDRP